MKRFIIEHRTEIITGICLFVFFFALYGSLGFRLARTSAFDVYDILFEIDTPRSKQDFDFLLWQISHRDIKIYKDEGSWYLMAENPCNHIQRDGRCGIYDDRPQICRDYSNDYCEFDEPAEGGFELYFEGYDALLKYCKKRFKRWGQRPY